MSKDKLSPELQTMVERRYPEDWSEFDTRAVDTVRTLAADAVQKTGNGHPGTAISLAPAAYLLYQKVMRHDPADPHWLGRDRFVLSVGHASMLLYSLLHLAGVEEIDAEGNKTGEPAVSLHDIEQFRHRQRVFDGLHAERRCAGAALRIGGGETGDGAGHGVGGEGGGAGVFNHPGQAEAGHAAEHAAGEHYGEGECQSEPVSHGGAPGGCGREGRKL